MGFSARSVNSSSAVDAPQFLLATCEKLSMPINSFSQLAGAFRRPSTAIPPLEQAGLPLLSRLLLIERHRRLEQLLAVLQKDNLY